MVYGRYIPIDPIVNGGCNGLWTSKHHWEPAAPQKSICPEKSIVLSCGMETPPGQRSWKNCFNQLGMKAAMLYFIAEALMTCQCQETGNTWLVTEPCIGASPSLAYKGMSWVRWISLKQVRIKTQTAVCAWINGHFRILDWRYLPYIRPM